MDNDTETPPLFDDAFYGRPENRSGKRDDLLPAQTTAKIQNLLDEADATMRDRVERVVKQWNAIIREHLRNETGLRLSSGGVTQQVPVRVVDGLPRPLGPVIDYIDGWVLRLLRHRKTFPHAIDLLGDVGAFYEPINDWLQSQQVTTPASKDEVSHVRELLVQLQKHLPLPKIKERIRKINTDVLGAYFFRVPKIEIYWMAIGLYAQITESSVEGLTVTVLAHELAHAYTHLGFDIDQEQWDTEAFAKTDLCIVEGLAQFYTAIVGLRLAEKLPEADAAYKAFLDLQSGPYRAHLAWAKSLDEACEVVRTAMLETRFSGTTSYPDYVAQLNRYYENLKGIKEAVKIEEEKPAEEAEK